MKVVVVIPTYNEEENLRRLLPLIKNEFDQIVGHECHVLIVDGNSTDRTQEFVEDFMHDHSNFHLMIETEKEGIGAAYMKGFKKAMFEYFADVVIEMDGDLQHDPKDIRRFLVEIDSGYDYVLGSRYIEGGTIPKEWGIYRKILSWGGSMFSRLFLGVWSVRDFTTGFKATRVRNFLDKIDPRDVLSYGFAYKVDLLYKTYKLGARIKEIPISFGLRDRGDSKLERGNFIDFIKVVFKIRYKENPSLYKFLVTGVFGMFVDFLFSNLLKLAQIRPGYAATLGVLIAMMTTFTLNNTWSFRVRAKKGIIETTRSFFVYIFTSSLPVFLRFGIVELAVFFFGDNFFVYNLSLVISVLIGVTWNYFIYNNVIWKKTNG
jgi:dolichol-phosphate mannosyltransferase